MLAAGTITYLPYLLHMESKRCGRTNLKGIDTVRYPSVPSGDYLVLTNYYKNCLS